MTFALIAGVLLGFVGSIPIAGPISALVLERTLAGEPSRARGIGIGAAVAESAYATVAFVGMGEIASRFPNLMASARVFGIVVLLIVAALLLRQRDTTDGSSAAPRSAREERRALHRGFATGFTIAILNPTLIATWSTTTAALFASGFVVLGVGTACAFAAGTTLGIASWLVALVSIVRHRTSRLGANGQRIARRVGAALALVAALALGIEASGILTLPR